MKRASKLLWLLLPVVITVSTFAGCSVDEDGNSQPTGGLHDTNLSDWTTVYLKLDETTDLNRAINRFHLHANDGNVEIQKVFVNTVKSTVGATWVLDFTQNTGIPSKPTLPYIMDSSCYDYTCYNIVDGGTADGRWVVTGTGDYVYGGNFGSGTAFAQEANYWGFVIKSSGLGDVRFGLYAAAAEIYGDNGSAGKTLRLVDVLEKGSGD